LTERERVTRRSLTRAASPDNLPTSGSATYVIAGAPPVGTSDNQTPGSVDSGSLRVAFGAAPLVGVELGVRVAGNDYLVGSSGGIAAPSMALNTNMEFLGFSAVTGGTASACTAAMCTGTINGFLAGTGASHAGVACSFGLGPGRSASAFGTVGFRRGP